ncbi:hypothetical protein D3C76_1117980 [compost metagenome]
MLANSGFPGVIERSARRFRGLLHGHAELGAVKFAVVIIDAGRLAIQGHCLARDAAMQERIGAVVDMLEQRALQFDFGGAKLHQGLVFNREPLFQKHVLRRALLRQAVPQFRQALVAITGA